MVRRDRRAGHGAQFIACRSFCSGTRVSQGVDLLHQDRVEARVTRDVRVHDTVAIPAGTRALGSVVSVERGGKFRERARLGIRFDQPCAQDFVRFGQSHQGASEPIRRRS